MIFVHEVHDVGGGKMAEYGEAVRTRWPRVVGEPGQARLLWYWELAHGTGASYQAVSLTAVRDWAAWGELVRAYSPAIRRKRNLLRRAGGSREQRSGSLARMGRPCALRHKATPMIARESYHCRSGWALVRAAAWICIASEASRCRAVCCARRKAATNAAVKS